MVYDEFPTVYHLKMTLWQKIWKHKESNDLVKQTI